MKALFGYIVTAILAPLAGYFAGKHTSPELGATVAAGVAGFGGRILHTTEAPTK